ncbi:DNA processing protein [Desulfonispora thiosulfatigenes DSM 11270]|uniref:DNA processing protein n=1 Tax=Desulfonispora thiosulfatigenes DSM 11270 TaxID=656914 RepID=A0A1W1VKM2_DESTI|nr:DNA-processing protein DprA [Desulfonispora thiosulfatigenes]SMB93935.1 DNA processing protein [Desulfonispora thiosulfatigenes DSM 11270]
MNKDFVYWSMLQKIWGIKASKILLNIMLQVSGYDFWHFDNKTIKNYLPNLDSSMVQLFITERKKMSFQEEYEKLMKLNIKIISFTCDNYPSNLKNIHSPPPLLYIRGNLVEKNLSIAMVGARKATAYGRKVAKQIASDLSSENVQIISGLARGIDTCSHEGALLGDGGTIAVLGSGLDVIYPRENELLFNNILKSGNGAIISEFPLGTQPLRYHFPMRNRIISGISHGVIVVEASEKSGSLITTEYGLEQGKDIFAIPGPINSSVSKGCHKLLKEGAKLVDSKLDVLEEYGQLCLFNLNSQMKNAGLSTLENEIVTCIKSLPLTMEEISEITNIPLKNLIPTISILEINGVIQQIAGRKFISIN